MNDNTNIGFTPEKVFLKEANDKIIFESFDVLNSGISISDPSVKDNDTAIISLSANNTDSFIVGQMKNIETLHINATGNLSSEIEFYGISGMNTIELAGDATGLIKIVNDNSPIPNGVSKIDASGLTSAKVFLDATNSSVKTLVGGAMDDILFIGKDGGTLTGGAGKDLFDVSAAQGGKLVTITDIGAGDIIELGSHAYTGTPQKLTVTEAADETTFVKTLQAQADNAGSTGVYYAEFNGNTYLVANGLYGAKTVTISENNIGLNFEGEITGTAYTDRPALNTKDIGTDAEGTRVMLNDVSATAGSGTITIADNAVSSGSKITGTDFSFGNKVSATADVHGYYLDYDTGIGRIPRGHFITKAGFDGSGGSGDFKITGIFDKSNGVQYNFSDFATMGDNTITISNGKANITGTLKGFDPDQTMSPTTSFNNIKLNVTGTVEGSGNSAFTGVLNDDVYTDDIIVKLAGSHDLATEATFNTAGDGDLIFK